MQHITRSRSRSLKRQEPRSTVKLRPSVKIKKAEVIPIEKPQKTSENHENSEQDSKKLIKLPSIFAKPDLFQENEQKFASFVAENPNSFESQLFSLQKVYYLRKSGLKAPLINLSQAVIDHFGKEYPEFRCLELDLEVFRKKILEVESQLLEKEVQLAAAGQELEDFLGRPYEESLIVSEFEQFLRQAVSVMRKYWNLLFRKEEIHEILGKIGSDGWDIDESNAVVSRLTQQLNKLRDFEGDFDACPLWRRHQFFQRLYQGKFLVFSEKMEDVSEEYIKYRIFRKKLEVFLVLDEKIDLASFVFQNSTKAYEDLHDYLFDVIDLSELPVISHMNSSGKEKILLFEQQSFEVLETLLSQARSFCPNINEPQEEGAAEPIRVREFLAEKRDAAVKLESLLSNYINKPTKDTGDAGSFAELKSLCKKSNVFLRVFTRIYEKKLERKESFFAAQLKPATKTNEKPGPNEALLIENYARETSQELFELLSLTKLSYGVLSALSQHYDNFIRLKIEGYPKEKKLLGQMSGLVKFLEALKGMFREFKELKDMQEFLDLPGFGLLFERQFFRLELGLDALRKTGDLLTDFPIRLIRDQGIIDKILYFRAFLWLKEEEAFGAQTKPKRLSEVSLLQDGLEKLKQDFPGIIEPLLGPHYLYKEFNAFSQRFTTFFSLYHNRILAPLAYKEPLELETHEDFLLLRHDLQFLRSEAKALHLEFEVGLKHIEDFEILARESEKTGVLLAKVKEGSGLAVDQVRTAHEFSRNCKLTALFPYFEKSKETAGFYQAALQQLVEIKKVFNEKKLRYTKLIVLQLHCREGNCVASEHVGFELGLYADFMQKVKGKLEIERLLELLARQKFNVRNYKEILKQSFQITSALQENIRSFLSRRKIEDLDSSNAVEVLSEIIALRNELVRKPAFFCDEMALFSCFEFRFQAMSLLQGLVSYGSKAPEPLIDKPQSLFLMNSIELWRETLNSGTGLLNLYESNETEEVRDELQRVKSAVQQIEERLSRLEGLREPIKQLRAFQQFLLEQAEGFFEEVLLNGFSDKTKDFLTRRQGFLDWTADFQQLAKDVLDTHILVSEDLEFLKDLHRKSEEITRSLNIINQTVKKSVKGMVHRSLPSDLVINVFRSLHSSPFKFPKSEELLNRLISMIRRFKDRASRQDPGECLDILRLYSDNPIFLPEFEPLLSDLKEFEFVRNRLLEAKEPEKPISQDEDDVIEIEEEDEEPEFSWEDCEELGKKLHKREFYREVEGFDVAVKELWGRKLKIMEQISFNRRPKAFFQVTREDLRVLAVEGEGFMRIMDQDEGVKKNMAFLKRFISKVNGELLRIARTVLSNRESIGQIKESSQVFAKCVDLSNEIQKIVEMSEGELRIFVNRAENNESFRERLDVLEEKPNNQEENKNKPSEETKITENQPAKNFKTFQSMFSKPNKPAPAKRGRPGQNQKKPAADQEPIPQVVDSEITEQKQQEPQSNPDQVLELFKSRKVDRGNLVLVERERARSVELLTDCLQKNPHLPSEYSFKWVASRLEAQLFRRYTEAGEKYRRAMIELMDVLQDLARQVGWTGRLLKDEKAVSLEELLMKRAEIKRPLEEKKMITEEKETMEMNGEVMQEEEDLEGLMELIREEFQRDKEVLLVEEEA